ncbi:MAG: hypothetical protein ACJ786_28850 [Catenulispora sp.]
MTLRSKLLRLTVGGAAALVLGAAAFAAAPAQAAPVPNHASGDRVLTAPAAPPAGAQSTAGVVPNASAPTVSPSVSTIHIAPGASYTCYSGDLCPVVWDYSTSSYKVFFMFNCARYTLYNWLGSGNYSDRQSSNALTIFYGAGGSYITSFYPPKTNVPYDWTPVYYIRNC